MALLGRILDIECQRIGLFDDGNIVRPDSDGDAVAAIVEQIARNMANRTKHPKRRCFLTPIRIPRRAKIEQQNIVLIIQTEAYENVSLWIAIPILEFKHE